VVTAADAVLDPAAGRNGPVIVLTYPFAGAGILLEALSASPSLICSAGTGIVPLLHAAVGAWASIEGPDQPPSRLALTSVRTLAHTMIATLLAQSGKRRWCEVAFTDPAAAGTFLRVFPLATVVCLHRQLASVAAEGLNAHPWGLADSVFWEYASARYGDNATAIASYWAEVTEQLLNFEQFNEASCIRIKYEDLVSAASGRKNDLYARLGIEIPPASVQSAAATPPANANGARPPADFPLTRLGPGLRAKIDDLHQRLDYSAASAYSLGT
jgi:hypothetical protein